VRWVRYRRTPDPTVRVGVVQDGIVHGGPGSITDLLARRGLATYATRLLAEAEEVLSLDEVSLLAPVEDPPSVRDFMAFERHVEGMGMLVGAVVSVPDVWYAQPLFYFSNPASILGPNDDVRVPPGCEVFDFELEVAAVVGPLEDGQALSDLTIEEAQRAIVGHVLMNDWSARDLQAAEMQGPLGPCKGKDSAITLGPWLLTADEPLDEVNLSARVDGRLIGEDTMASMAWSFAEMIAYASRGTTLRVGDVIGSGTCGGGCLAEHWGRRGHNVAPALGPGDMVELSAGPLGMTHNRVVAGGPIRQPLARRRRNDERSNS
jgi:2-keto-4-pentenoate hydratase/2-oxohepta-3-ene-1,7-dioic acid hydratase in catechol pathway